MGRVRRTAATLLACALGIGLSLGATPGWWTRAEAASGGAERDPAPAQRVVSINPSLTAILVDLGASELLVGVDDFSARQEPTVAALPRVGGLYDPSLETVVALRPDLVVLVPSAQQRDFRERLEAVGIPVLAFDPKSLEDVLASIESIGERVGRLGAARERVAAIRAEKARVEKSSAGRPRPRTVLVLQREPLYVVGAGSFIDDMLRASGAENLAAALPDLYPRAGLEWLLAARPELILDASPDAEPPGRYWARWPSLPAVASGRVERVEAGLVTLPGPRLDRALDALATAVQGSSATTAREGPP